MASRTARLVPFLLLAGSLACASSGTQGASSSGTRAARSPNLINAPEVATVGASNAYEVIVRLRPQWLRTSGVASIGAGARQAGIVAYVDNVRLSRVDELRTISAGAITSIRFLNAEQASALDSRAGLVAGAIVVSTNSHALR